MYCGHKKGKEGEARADQSATCRFASCCTTVNSHVCGGVEEGGGVGARAMTCKKEWGTLMLLLPTDDIVRLKKKECDSQIGKKNKRGAVFYGAWVLKKSCDGKKSYLVLLPLDRAMGKKSYRKFETGSCFLWIRIPHPEKLPIRGPCCLYVKKPHPT